jgi:uncharacterized protein (TIGR03067 family)
MKYFCIGGALLLTALVQSGWSADSPAATGDMKALNGRWVPTSAVMAGKPYSDDACKAIHAVFNNGKYQVKVGDQTDKGTYTVDESKDPKTLTIVGTSGPNKDKTIPAIYELDKNTLKVCYDLSGKAAPTKFESAKDSQLFLVTYERQARKAGKSRAIKVDTK